MSNVQERERIGLAFLIAETMYSIWELEHQLGELNLDMMVRRPNDLSAYSLTHAEIMEQLEGVELLALGMFFGSTRDSCFHNNQERLKNLSDDTVDYQGRAEVIEYEIAGIKLAKPPAWKMIMINQNSCGFSSA